MPEIEIPKKRQPEKKFRAGSISVAIWRNKKKDGTIFHTVTFEKWHKKGDEWKAIKSLTMNDLPKAVVALQKAYEYLVLKKTGKEIIEEETEE